VGYSENSDAIQSVTATMPSGSKVEQYGMRTGVEYQINPNRTLELFGNYAVNDDLDPLPHPPDQSPRTDFVARIRNTIPTGNYGTAESRRRRYDLEGANP
jgi:hypothetical protein